MATAAWYNRWVARVNSIATMVPKTVIGPGEFYSTENARGVFLSRPSDGISAVRHTGIETPLRTYSSGGRVVMQPGARPFKSTGLSFFSGHSKPLSGSSTGCAIRILGTLDGQTGSDVVVAAVDSPDGHQTWYLSGTFDTDDATLYFSVLRVQDAGWQIGNFYEEGKIVYPAGTHTIIASSTNPVGILPYEVATDTTHVHYCLRSSDVGSTLIVKYPKAGGATVSVASHASYPTRYLFLGYNGFYYRKDTGALNPGGYSLPTNLHRILIDTAYSPERIIAISATAISFYEGGTLKKTTSINFGTVGLGNDSSICGIHKFNSDSLNRQEVYPFANSIYGWLEITNARKDVG